MLIQCIATLALLLVAHPTWSAEPHQIAFERGTDVWVANLDGSGAKKIARGSQPSSSFDGARIAFNTDESSKEVVRHIAVADVATQKVTVFKKEIPSHNCQHAVLSPDGSQIVFSLFSGSDWDLGLINADGSDFRYLKKIPREGSSLWSVCWAPDGKSIYAQDLNKIVQLGLDGSELRTWSLRSLFPDGGLSSGSQMSVSPDGKTLVVDVEMESEEANRDDWDGPPPGIWTVDLASEKVTRLTPKGFFGWSPVWLSNDEILFVSQRAKEKQSSLYQMSADGQNRKQLIKNADRPSASR